VWQNLADDPGDAESNAKWREQRYREHMQLGALGGLQRSQLDAAYYASKAWIRSQGRW
jgi:hypothetical protein